jgi:hypothetical protein
VRRIGSLAAFAVRTNFRMWTTRIGLLFGVGILLLGPLSSLSAGDGWAVDGELAFFGLLVALVFGLRSGLEQHREHGLAEFLQHNLIGPVPYAAAMLLSVLTAWLLISLGAWAVVVAISGGDVATASWRVGSWALRAAVLVGFVPLVERYLTIRLPFFLPAGAYFLILIQLTFIIGEVEAMERFAPVDRGGPSSLVPLVGQVLAFLPLSAVLLLATAGVEGWLRSRRRAAAQSRTGKAADIDPSRHGGAPHQP